MVKKAKRWFVLLPIRFLPADIRLGQIGSGIRDARLLYLAAKLGIADELAEADCLRLLHNTKVAMGSFNATIVIIDYILPESKADRLMALSDMQLFAEKTGKERTLSQWALLIEKSNFELVEMVSLKNETSALVLCSNNAIVKLAP